MAIPILNDIRLYSGGKLYLWTGHNSNFLKYNLWQASASGGMTIKNIANNGSIIFQTESTTVLTLDGSQNATFAGTITTGDNGNDNYISATFSDSSYTRIHGYGLYMSRDNSYIRPTTDTGKTLYIGSSDKRWDNVNVHATNATFAGNVKLSSTGAATFSIENTNASQTWGQYVGSNDDYVFRDFTDSRSTLVLHGNGDATFAGSVTVSGTSSTFNTGNSGTFVTNDTNNYPRLTMTSASAQLGLFRAGDGGMYIGGSSDGFRIYTAGFSQKLLVDQSGNATFSGDIKINTGSHLFFDGGTNATYISEDVADRLRFFVGGAEFMRFTEDTADMINFYRDVTVSGTTNVDAITSNQFNARNIGNYITFYGNDSDDHSISSRNLSGAPADDLRFNSYGAMLFNLDSNSNNGSNADFIIGRHGGGTDDTISDILFTLSGETGNATFTGNINTGIAGKVSVGGTHTPTSQVHIKNTSGDNRGLIVENTVTTSYAEVAVKAAREFRIGTGGSGTGPNGTFYIYDATAARHRIDLDANGNVGIGGGTGALAPNSKLDVRRAGNGIALELHQTSGSADDYVDLKMIAGNTTAGTLGTILRHKRDGTGGGDFSILTNPTLTGTPVERLKITSSGNTTFAGDVTLSAAGSTGEIIRTTDNTEPYFALQRNSGSNGVGVLRLLDGGDLTFDTGATGAGQTTRLTIDGATGNATFAGNVILNSRLTFDYGGDHYFEAGTNTLAYKSSSGTSIMLLNASTSAATFSGDVGIGATNSDGDSSIGTPKLHVLGVESTGRNLAARFQGGNDSDNTYASMMLNHANDRGLIFHGGRASGNRAIGFINLIQYDGTELVDGITLHQPASASAGGTTGTNVGIGTTAPGYKLEIAEDTNGTADLLFLRNSDATYAQTWGFQSDTNKDLVITGSSGVGGFKFVPGSRGTTFTGDVSASQILFTTLNGHAKIDSQSSSIFIEASNIQAMGNLIPDGTGNRNLGASNRYWAETFTNGVTSGGNITINSNTPVINLGVSNTSTGNSKINFFSKNNNAANAYSLQFNKDTGIDRLEFIDGSGNANIKFNNGGSASFAGDVVITTQSAGDNSTKAASTAFVTTAVSNIVNSAPSTLDTLNELAAALGDDANFSTTVTNSIATKLPLTAGSTNKLTGTLYIQGTNTTNAESVLLRGVSSNDGDFLGSIRTANTGGYNQEMRFYTSNANGTTDEDLTLTLKPDQSATFAGAVSTGGYLTLNSGDNIPRLIFNGSGDDFFLSNTATYFGLYNDTDSRWDIQVDGAGDTTFGGNIIAEDSEVHVGDTSGDSWTRILHAQADGYGFDWQHNNATVLVNEQGSTNQVLVLGDVDAGDNDGLFGIAGKTASTDWVKKLNLKGNGELYIGSAGTSQVYHEGHKPTLSELGAASSSVVNQTDFVSKANGGTFSGDVSVFPNAGTGTFRVGRYAGQEFKLHATDLVNTLTSINDEDENQTHDFILDRVHAGSGANNFKIQKDGSNQLTIDKDGLSTFTGDVVSPGIYVGSRNASFDFYNNGTTYLNGAVTVDAAFTQSGGGASTFSGSLTIPDYINHTGDSGTKFGFSADDTFVVRTGGAARLTVNDTTATFAGDVVNAHEIITSGNQNSNNNASGADGRYATGILDLSSGSNLSAGNNFRIETNIPFNSGGADFTVTIQGFQYGSRKPVNLTICWHIYPANTPYNHCVISHGGWSPVIKMARNTTTNNVTLLLETPGYWPKMYVKSLHSSNYEVGAYAKGWTWTNGTLASGYDIITTIPYQALSLGNGGITNGGAINGDTITGTTLASTGDANIAGAVTASNDLTLNNSSPEMYFKTGASHYNWMIAAQENIDTALEFTPANAVGASGTHNTPALTLYANRNATFAGKITASGDPGVVVTSSGNSTIHVASTGTGLAGMYMDASNGDFIGSDYVFVGQDNDKTFRLESFNSSGDILLKESNTNTLRLSGGDATFAGAVALLDGKKLEFGGGGDFKIWHAAGENTYLRETGEGATVFQSNGWYFQNTASPAVTGMHLTDTGTATFAGTVTATHFHGDGSNLTNLPATQSPVYEMPDTGSTAGWHKIGTLSSFTVGGRVAVIQMEGHAGYNAANNQDFCIKLYIKTSNGNGGGPNNQDYNSWYERTGLNSSHIEIVWDKSAANTYDLYAYLPVHGLGGYYTVTNKVGSWAHSGASASDPGANSTTILEAVHAFNVDGNISASSGTFAGNLTFGDSHFIGDDADDNLLIQSSANENIIINSPDDDVLIRTAGATRLQITNTQATFAGDVNLSTGKNIFISGGSGLRLLHDGTNGHVISGTGQLKITNSDQDEDILFRGNDGGSTFTALTLDMSEAGYATFNSTIKAPTLTGVNGLGATVYTINSTGVVLHPTGSVVRAGTGTKGVPSFSFVNDTDTGMYSDGANAIKFTAGGNDLLGINTTAGVVAVTGQLTTSNGIGVAGGHVSLNDDVQLQIGSSNDLKIFHNATDSFIINEVGNLKITNGANDKDIIFESDDGLGGTTEYFRVDGGETNTIFSRDLKFLDSGLTSRKAIFGTGSDLQIYHDASNSYIKNNGGNLYIQQNTNDGDIIFQSDNGSGGVESYLQLDGGNRSIIVTAALGVYHNDGIAARFGDSGDLQIYHNGSDSYIKDSGTGDLRIVASKTRFYDADLSHLQAEFTDGGSVDLYHSGNKKFETTSTGVAVTGNIAVTGTTDGVDLSNYPTQPNQLTYQTLVAHFSQTAGSTSTFNIPMNNTTESTTATYYHVWTAPFNGQVKTMIMKHAHGTSPDLISSTPTKFRVAVNGTSADYTSSSFLTRVRVEGRSDDYYSYIKDDNINQAFSAGDRVYFQFLNASTSVRWRNCSVSIVVEYNIT